MASSLPAKSILKQHNPDSTSTISDEQKAKVERDRHHLGIALYHANKIQSQKDIQAQILSNIEKLVDLPAGPKFTSSEASKFVTSIQAFQPSDFDGLVEERTGDGKCGYTLCPKSPRSETLGTSAAWKLKAKEAGDYCSNDCMRKALYIKAQLSEVPAWERELGQQPEVLLHADDRQSLASSKPRSKDKVKQWLSNDQDLALERGETTASFRPKQVMMDNVVEKSNISIKQGSIENSAHDTHDAVEGYVPGQASSRSDATPTAKQMKQHDEAEDQLDRHITHTEEDESWRDLFENIPSR